VSFKLVRTCEDAAVAYTVLTQVGRDGAARVGLVSGARLGWFPLPVRLWFWPPFGGWFPPPICAVLGRPFALF
jgi:hypothetical protein